ncbi:E3 ubiquitin-protein ligase DZIP3-like [Mytilus edulis]|uniref:E3 ubiquitin-protein ligase DZIP3-like n=1 Tax=Mytilus edulis TaxID=6550 RepID=UPI0039EF2C59
MASLSEEEEKYLRMHLLLTGICPRAVRIFFDKEFPPACLYTSLKKEYHKLFDLKMKRLINQSQWNLLFPRFPDVPDSKTFDVTLVTTLLRNLTPMNPQSCGFDCLPHPMETTPAADLTRIKYYRNYLAYLKNINIESHYFNTAWTDITDVCIN